MINEERVILMTRMASYEAHEGKKSVKIGNYFRGDYIGFQVLKSVIAATIAFIIVFGVYIFYNFETFMQDIYKMDLMEYGKGIITVFLCVVGIYAVISYIVYAYRYSQAKKSLKVYYGNLRKLSAMYEK